MLFTIIRYAFCSIVFIISFFLIKKSLLVHKRRWSIIAFVVVVILMIIFSIIPIENAFITFSSPESAYHYNNSGNIKLIVDGERTDLIVSKKGDVETYAIVPKSDNGWKLGTGLDIKIIVQTTTSDGIAICVYQYKNTNDYYIIIWNIYGDPLDMKDNHDSEFKYLEESISALNKTYYTYYAYIDGFDNKYTLTVNGKTIKVQNEHSCKNLHMEGFSDR